MEINRRELETVGQQIFGDRPGRSAARLFRAWVLSHHQVDAIHLEVAQRTFRACENASEIETEFESRRCAIELERPAWIAPNFQVSNNHRSQKWRFDFTNFELQSFAMGQALRPDSQTAGHKQRSETDDDEHNNEERRRRNNKQSSRAHSRLNA